MKNASSLTLPLLLIIVGAVLFLKTTHILPATAVLIAAALAVVGIAVLVVDGINKQSVVTGPMLMYLGAAIYVRGEYWFGYSLLIAIGMMLLGSLMLLARSNLVQSKRGKPGAR